MPPAPPWKGVCPMGVDAEMFVRVRGRWTGTDVRRLAGEMCAAFGTDRFMLDKSGEFSGVGPRHALAVVPEYDQDGPTIIPDSRETFIRVYLWTRVYVEGYERGDLPFILALADWLERKTGGAVWYGGDSSGICAEPLTPSFRERLWAHFVEHGHKPYVERGWSFGSGLAMPFCDFCQRAFFEYGSGPSGAMVRCAGCDARMRQSGSGFVADTSKAPA